MFNIPIKIEETAGISRNNQPESVCLSFRKGQLLKETALAIKVENEILKPCQITPLSYWEDKSIKWAKINFIVDIKGHKTHHYFIVNENIDKEISEISVTSQSDFLDIETEKLSINMPIVINSPFAIFEGVTNQKANKKLFVKLIDNNDNEFDAVIKTIDYDEGKSLKKLQRYIFIKGEFSGQCLNHIKFEAKITVFANSSYLKMEFTIHNPLAARHPGGLWDLGDVNSINFKSLALHLPIEDNSTTRITDHSTLNDWVFGESVYLQQFASGGENWNSPVHQNADGKVILQKNGYVLVAENKEVSGARISPSVHITNETKPISVFVEKFWENFPKAINKTESLLTVALFPEGNFELQGGEKKTHSIWIDFNSENQNFDWVAKPLNVTLAADYIAATNSIGYFSHVYQDDEILNIINGGIQGKDTFFDKREVVDEYGWRNFGELYADHETAGYDGTEIFVSHYNNQYDPIYGFIYQYLLTGKEDWFELADDLACHVKDIDIYHTIKDKDEYNGGLFWHTDHYLNASTCTHRTFSKNHQAAYDGYTSGGGPGGQHCYTTGLKLHYFLTGKESSKQAVLQLADWITYSFEGANTVLAKLFAIKQSGAHGIKDHITGQYPMDRGTGHYIIALLDAFSLTSKDEYLQRAFLIIKHTFHPQDDINIRNFENIEATWFYTVFLQAVIRYLIAKEQMEALDNDFYFARDALLHYANWMCDNEEPYLEQKEKLEFPNATWTAQDLRKVAVLYAANYYATENKGKYLVKAEGIYQYIARTLINEPSRNYTRIRVLLMQNIGSVNFFKNRQPEHNFESVKEHSKDTNVNKWLKIIKIIIKALSHLSIKNELKWLSLRSEKVAKLFGNKL